MHEIIKPQAAIMNKELHWNQTFQEYSHGYLFRLTVPNFFLEISTYLYHRFGGLVAGGGGSLDRVRDGERLRWVV